MNDNLKQVLMHASHEIRDLRRRNEILSAKVEVLDLFGRLLPRDINAQGAMRLDITWELERQVSVLDEAEKASARPQPRPRRRK